MEVEYVDQIYLANDVEIRTGIEKIGNSSFTIQEELYQTDRLCAKGKSIYVNYNFRTEKPESIPETIRNKLEKISF